MLQPRAEVSNDLVVRLTPNQEKIFEETVELTD